jgi:hypothetical protein
MTTSTQTIELAALGMHREPVRKNGIVAVCCIFAFIASCAMPAVIWSARLGLSAWSDHRPAEPERLLSFCIVPDVETKLVLIGDKDHGPDSRHCAALLGR